MTQKTLHIITPQKDEFESAYIKARSIENRVYSDDEVKQLPISQKQESEWKLRAKSAKRFENYLKVNHSESRLLEIGCGNGWFSYLCSKYTKSVCGVDLNLEELEQASRVFKKDNLHFYCWDLFSKNPFDKEFDVIVLNAVVQYFSDFEKLKTRLINLLNPNGEIHLIDSPFYLDSEVEPAQKRTKNYYTRMGVPEMNSFYFHHKKADIKDFETLYRPNKLKSLILGKDSPFGWYRFKR